MTCEFSDIAPQLAAIYQLKPCYSKTNAHAQSSVWHLQLANGQHIALKRVRAQHAEAASLLYREHEFLEKLTHRNIVSLVCHGYDADAYIIVTEWIDGFVLENNSELLRSELAAKSTTEQFINELRSIAALLSEHQICHRDLWGKNIIVQDNHPILLDFGWAKWQSEDNIFTPKNLREPNDHLALNLLINKFATPPLPAASSSVADQSHIAKIARGIINRGNNANRSDPRQPSSF